MRSTALALLASVALIGPAAAQDASADWQATLDAAQGQTVYWNAWGGDDRINDFMAWAGTRVEEEHGVTVVHVKLTDTADAVNRVISETAAGVEEGAVDAIWINGENFINLKREGLLHGPFAEDLPNYALVNTENDVVRIDFQEPVEGMESPWLLAQFVLYHDTEFAPEPPRSPQGWLDYAAANPGRLSYPAPPDFTGQTFLKQMLVSLEGDIAPFLDTYEGAEDEVRLERLFAWLDDFHPNAWRSGETFPASAPALRSLVADGELDVGFSNNPAEAAGAIASGEFAETVRAYTLDGGTIGNASFIAIPKNATAAEGAEVLANFLLSPEAQARMQDPEIWGAPTVLDVAGLEAEDAAAFEGADAVPGFPAPSELRVTLAEPDNSWVEAIEAEWLRRYGS